MSSPRGQASRPPPPAPVARPGPRRRWPVAWLAVIIVTVIAVIAAEHTSHGQSIVSSIQEFLLTYAGVFALIGITAAVGVGLLATDRIVLRPGHRVVAQSVHRGVSLGALAALIVHVTLEIVAHKVGVLDVVVPFLSRFRTLYTGLGTLAADLFVLIVVTGFLRGRFAGKWPWAWRSIHAAAYAAWPLSVVHGLLGGRTAKPYVDWSYGGCLALVAIALAIRVVATVRSDTEKLAHPVPDRLSVPAEGLIPGSRVTMAPLGSGAPGSAPLGSPRPARRELSAAPAARSGLAQPAPALYQDDQYGEAQYPRPRYPQARYSQAEYSQARYSQAQELQRQQRQAQQRQERLMHQEAPTPGWAPEGSDRADATERSSDSDMTDPHGWPSAAAPADAYGWPDARDLTDAHGWTDTIGEPGGAGRAGGGGAR
jgi:hypothetical protein